MTNTEIVEWIKTEFLPVQLLTGDETILQIIANAKRFFNTHSAYPVARMYAATTGTVTVSLHPDYKNVVQIYPATTPDWVLQNYPLWSLLGITIVDNLTSDLILLSEAYRNYRYYIGTDFKFVFQKSEDPSVGGKLYLSNLPGPTTSICVIGTKRIVDGSIQGVAISGISGTLTLFPIDIGSLVLTNGTHTFTDAGDGTLTSSISGYSGTIDYTTGEWAVTGWSGILTGTANYNYYEDIKVESILDWLLYYVKSLVKMVEGASLRKADSIDVKNDGQEMYNEGKEEKKELEEKLAAEGKWLSFCRRF